MENCNTVFAREIDFRHAIGQTRSCQVKANEGVVHVKLVQRNGIPWEGEVHVFQVSGHSHATYCYAWAEQRSETRVVIHAVLKSEKLSSPEKAVQSVLRRGRPRKD